MSLFAIAPFSLAIIFVTAAHMLHKINVGIPDILLEPVSGFFIIAIGAMGTCCIIFRQLAMFILFFILTIIGFIVVYIQYVL